MSEAEFVQQTARPEGRRAFSPQELIFWIVLAGYLALVVGFAWNPSPLAQLLAALGIMAACAHAALTYGLRNMVVLVAICVAVTFTIENIGVTTGWPFGRYHFEVGSNLLHVGAIPIIVGPLWFGMGYFSWIVAGTLFGGAQARISHRLELWARPVVAAFVMAQWDLVMDPSSSTISKAWIWHDGGAHFGVPVSNYLGWLLTAWLFYQAFAIYLSRRSGVSPFASRHGRRLRLVAILFYLAAALTHLTPWLIGQGGEVVDAAHQVWRVGDLRQAAAVTMLFTMFFTSMLATLRLVTDNPDR
jgi:uncharacterized membrane protein